MINTSKKIIYFSTISIIAWHSSKSIAVTPVNQRPHFITELEDLNPALPIQIKAQLIDLKIPMKKFKTRLTKGNQESKIEPIYLNVPKHPTDLQTMVDAISRDSQASKLYESLVKKLQKSPPSQLTRARLLLEPKDFKWANPIKVRDLLSKPHYKLTIDSKQFKDTPKQRRQFLKQLRGHLKSTQIKRLRTKIRKGLPLNIDQDLLPSFAKKMVRKFLVVRGPNCFHASLSFYRPYIGKAPQYNVKEELGYHRAMINYDELWRILDTQFYEVDNRKYGMKYGDILVFFELEEAEQQITSQINYKWIRHTSIYLFDGYTFSKGSKSPSTPYSVKKLSDEWQTWQSYTKSLGVKVFRPNSRKKAKRPPSFNLQDWVY